MNQFNQLKSALKDLLLVNKEPIPVSYVLSSYSVPFPELKKDYLLSTEEDINAMVDEIQLEIESLPEDTPYDVGNLKINTADLLTLEPDVIIPIKAKGLLL